MIIKVTFVITGYGSFVRWGRKTCPKGSDFVYRGILKRFY